MLVTIRLLATGGNGEKWGRCCLTPDIYWSTGTVLQYCQTFAVFKKIQKFGYENSPFLNVSKNNSSGLSNTSKDCTQPSELQGMVPHYRGFKFLHSLIVTAIVGLPNKSNSLITRKSFCKTTNIHIYSLIVYAIILHYLSTNRTSPNYIH